MTTDTLVPTITNPLLGSQQHEEYQYLNLLKHIINHGEFRADRTGTGTLSVFAPPQMRFSLRDGSFPLLTTKRVFLRGIIEELLWFIRGDTDARILQEKNVRIWDGNASREFLDSVGLSHRREGDLGPVYGFQWRHFGAEYETCESNYDGKGVDQLSEIMDKIRNKPYDRRIILSAWNPKDIPIMALPPCHMFCQFYISNPEAREKGLKPVLSCVLYQRSADMGLGVPFNIASYALLLLIVAHMTDTTPGDFIHTLGDAHVYKDHVEPLQVQITREPRPFPKMRIKRSPEEIGKIENLTVDDFILEEYTPHPKVEMKMSV